MSNLYWLGNATAVAQVATGAIASVDATPANNTFTVTIGGVAVSVAGITNANTTAAALVTALNASTHPYFSTITWTNPSAANVAGTSDVAGLPFVAVISKTGGGTGTVTAFAATTASSGPNDWSTAANWSTGVVPASGDTVIFANSAVNVCWGLLTAVTGVTVIRHEQTYTGRMGLDYKSFATSSDGATVNSSYPEYRQLYLSIGVSSWRVGDTSSFGSPSGSGRLMIDLGTTTACTVDVLNSANTSADTNRPAVRILGVKSTHAVNVRSAPGGVGICAEVPGEVSTMAVNVADTTSTSKVITGTGFTPITWNQSGGNNVLQSNQTMPSTTVTGGILRTEGSGATTAMSCLGGTTNHNSGTASNVTTTITLRGGALSGLGSGVARTWSTVNYYKNSNLSYDPSVVTVSALTAQERVTLTT